MGQVVDGVPSAVRADDVEVQVHVIGGVWGASWRQPASTCTVSWDDIDNDGAFQSGISITRHLSADYVPPDRDAPVEDDPSTGPVRPSDPIRRTRTYPLWDKVFATEIGSCLRLVMTDLWPDHPELLGIVVTGNDVWLHDSTGSGVGLVTEWIEMCGLERTTELVADAVQEAAIDALWGERRTPTWPTCPDHPTTHALSVRTVGDAASWVCPAFDRVIARIGELHG
jgi:hypothetical protein